ncbi:DUF4062 domain-containing protein [Serratia proteamaculans]|uniref:DUF4062 domain-containing protein n=1 Tax=Serratia proteamaculans TaxID=28151 RepID=UPI0039BE0FAF
MMKKRYQVFLSSTYKDLIEERQQVTTALMKMDCIPAGMELFPAIDLEQFEFIKKVIDDSDYYFIMVAGKYGSISPETGLSYTEMEYDYAVEKGLKIIALIFKDINQLTRDKTETEPEIARKLELFRQKISTGRLVNFWSNLSELPGFVAISLSQTMTMFPAEGWVRAGKVSSDEMLFELNELRKENEKLNKLKSSIENSFDKTYSTLKNNLRKVKVKSKENEQWSDCTQYNTSLLKIFESIAPYLMSEKTNDAVRKHISFGLSRYPNVMKFSHPMSLNAFADIISDLFALSLIEPSKKKHASTDKSEYLVLTKYGYDFHSHIRRLKLEDVTAQSVDLDLASEESESASQ